MKMKKQILLLINSYGSLYPILTSEEPKCDQANEIKIKEETQWHF